MDRRAQYPNPREEDSSEEISLIRPSNVHVLMFALYLFAGLLLFTSGFCAIAHAQANGTVIILELTPRGLFVAADSRSVVGTKTEDNHCKLVTLTNNSIFAVAGGSSYSAGKTDRAPSFDAIEEAKRAAVDSRTSSTAAQMLAVTADSWTNRMLANSNAIRKWHPDVIEEGAKKEKGLVTTGIFAKGWNGSIFMAFRQIKLTNGTITSEAPMPDKYCQMDHPCGAGRLDVLQEVFRLTRDERAKKEQLPPCPIAFTSCDPALLEVVRLVDLTIARNPHGTVGGPIDALQVGLDGRITWFQRKKNCAERYQ